MNFYNYETRTKHTARKLDVGLVRDWSDGLRNVRRETESVSFSWLSWLSLELNVLTLSLGLTLQSGILLDSVQEFLTALRVLDVLNTEVNTLFEVSVTDNLVDDDTNRRLGNVIDNTSSTLVPLVRHTLLDSTVTLDIDDVADLVSLHVSGQWNDTILLEVPLEHVTSTRSVSRAIKELVYTNSVVVLGRKLGPS